MRKVKYFESGKGQTEEGNGQGICDPQIMLKLDTKL